MPIAKPVPYSLLAAFVAIATAVAQTGPDSKKPLPDKPAAGLSNEGPEQKRKEAERLVRQKTESAVKYARNHEYAKAEPLLREAAALHKILHGENRPEYVGALGHLASCYWAMRDFDKAEATYRQALEIARKSLDMKHPHYARLLSDVAKLYAAHAAFDKAEPLFVENVELFRKVHGEKHINYAISLQNLAWLCCKTGQFERADRVYSQAYEAFRTIVGDRHPTMAGFLSSQGWAYHQAGDFAKAESLHAKAYEIYKQAPGDNREGCAASLNALATVYNNAGDFAKAERLYQHGLDIRKEASGKESEGYAQDLNNFANLYANMGEYEKSAAMYLQALEINTRVLGKNHASYGRNLHNLAGEYQRMGDLDQAEKLFLQAIEVYNAALGENDPYSIGSLTSLATVYNAKGEYDKAERLLVRAREGLAKAAGTKHPWYSWTLGELSRTYEGKGRYVDAGRLANEACGRLREEYGPYFPKHISYLGRLAWLYHAVGADSHARPLFEQAAELKLEVAEKTLPFLPEARAISFLQDLGTGCDGLLSAARRLPGARPADVYRYVWRTRGLVTRTLHERRQAAADSPEAKLVAAKLQKVQEALAQLTLATTSSGQREARNKRLAELNDQKEQLESQLVAASSEFRRSRAMRQARVEDLLKALPKDTAVVDLVRVSVWDPPGGGRKVPPAELQYEAFVLRSPSCPGVDAVAWVHLGPAGPVEQATFQWHQAIGELSRMNSRVAPPEKVLRERIWDPLEKHLAGCSTVVLLPTESLCFVPWGALPGKRPGTCLLEDYALATAQSGQQLLDAWTDSSLRAGGALLVGGVDYDLAPSGLGPSPTLLAAAGSMPAARSRAPAMAGRLHWSFLPGTSQEIAAIAPLVESAKPLVLQGAAASEAALRHRMPQCRYIHLATHGFFADPRFRSFLGQDVAGEQLFGGVGQRRAGWRAQVSLRNPMVLSGVVLAGANREAPTDELGLPTGEDGVLTAEELSALDLRNTELVVLSACDTGVALSAGDEGVMGLARAFHLAGARNVIASQWKVDDEATAVLMRLFYHNLWHENLPPGEALRRAQLFVYRHPELLGNLAASRGPDFAKTVKLATAEPAKRDGGTAPTRLWAGFVLSGPGR